MIPLIETGHKNEKNERDTKTGTADQASNGMHGSSGNNNRHRWHAPLLHYNKQASKILDRKPEYIGKDIHSHHKKATSNKKIDLMFQDFQKRRTEPFHYQAKPYGKTILVTLSPILENGKFIGCIQSVLLKEDIADG